MTMWRTMTTVGLTTLLLITGASPSPAASEPAPNQKRMWQENFEYPVEIAGAESPLARMFNASGRSLMMLMAPELKQPVILQVEGREVLTVDTQAIENGLVPEQVYVNDDVIVGPPSPYTMDGDAVIFFLDGRKV